MSADGDEHVGNWNGESIQDLIEELDRIEEHEDPNEVKVVVDNNNFAMYFSREPIPSRKKWAKNAAPRRGRIGTSLIVMI